MIGRLSFSSSFPQFLPFTGRVSRSLDIPSAVLSVKRNSETSYFPCRSFSVTTCSRSSLPLPIVRCFQRPERASVSSTSYSFGQRPPSVPSFLLRVTASAFFCPWLCTALNCFCLLLSQAEQCALPLMDPT